jgi:hypothetical protein
MTPVLNDLYHYLSLHGQLIEVIVLFLIFRRK